MPYVLVFSKLQDSFMDKFANFDFFLIIVETDRTYDAEVF